MAVPVSADLPKHVRRFLEEPRVATLSTANEDGAPHQAAIWYRLEPDGRVLVNSRTPRRWPANLRRDPRCSIAVIDGVDGYRWVGLTGIVEEVVEDVERARDDIVALAERYGDHDPATIAAFRSQPRVSFKVRVVGVHDHLDGD